MKSKIFYGLCGEGLGHASRALSVIDRLPDMEVHVFTFGKAYKFFKKMNYPWLHKIKGAMFCYTNGQVDYLKTIWKNKNLVMGGFNENIRFIRSKIKELKPFLGISDFEPTLSRAFKRIPYISIDNQHRFSHCEIRGLGFFLHGYCWATGLYANHMTPNPDKILISTFHSDTIKVSRKKNKTFLINSMMRDSVEKLSPTNDGYILCYLRESVEQPIIDSLQHVDQEVRVYGASNKVRNKNNNIKFFDLSPDFIKELAACDRVIASSGNQLLGECRYFQKPILAVPEPKQWEQWINSLYVEKLKLGLKSKVTDLNSDLIDKFSTMKVQCSSLENGTHDVEKIIRGYR